jgi:hypothetical protein
MRWTCFCRKACGGGRTVKPCGPGTSTLVSSCAMRFAQRRGLTSPIPRGEHGVSRKAIAQGVPECFGQPVVTTLVGRLPFSAHEAAGAPCARHSLRPLPGGTPIDASLGRESRRGNAFCRPGASEARPGTYDHRAMLLREGETPSHRTIRSCGYGSLLRAQLRTRQGRHRMAV